MVDAAWSLSTWLLCCVLLWQPAKTATMSCPVPLVSVGVGDTVGSAGKAVEGLQLVEGGLKYLESLRAPLYIVPMIGVYRGGKSMLLNRLMGLSTPYKSGFGIGHGQHTFTRGINVCAEYVDGLGSIAWLDTEGLFSSEDANSGYGPKIFSLTLLFSSLVMLNSVKVLNDQFFTFFGAQQEIARVLKQGLSREGLPQEAMLPNDLRAVWVLQQPIRYDSTGVTGNQQLQNFLGAEGGFFADEARIRVRKAFQHLIREVPIAVNSAQDWHRLDELSDDELSPEYLRSTLELRSTVLQELRAARPLQPGSVAKLLELYIQLVRTERFNGALAKEAFEEAKLDEVCTLYEESALQHAGPLPSTNLSKAFALATGGDVEHRRLAFIEEFHFGSAWSQRMERCFEARARNIQDRNAEVLLERFQAKASRVSEDSACYFISGLAAQLREHATDYGEGFSSSYQSRGLDFAMALQRTRIVECLKLSDFLEPVLPWVFWPVCNYYLSGGSIKGLMSMATHGVLLSGVYAVLQMFRLLPPFLDTDYQVLRAHPILIDLVMGMPPLIPWAYFSWLISCFGLGWSAWKFLQRVFFLTRPAGDGHQVSQLINLELQLNILMKRSEASLKQQLVSSALDAACAAEQDNARGVASALIRGLCVVRDLGFKDPVQVDHRLKRRIEAVLSNLRLPAASYESSDLAQIWREKNIVSHAARNDFESLLVDMVDILEALAVGDRRVSVMRSQDF